MYFPKNLRVRDMTDKTKRVITLMRKEEEEGNMYLHYQNEISNFRLFDIDSGRKFIS